MRVEHMARDSAGNDEIAALARLIEASKRIVVLTGAGISTESGIPDFRSPGGIWSRMQPITYQEFVASEEARLEDWRRRFRMNVDFGHAEPNAGHYGLAHMAAEGRLEAVITQNIDGLHQRAGLAADRVIEIHGNVTHGRCLDCGAKMSLDDARRTIETTGASPRCACGGLIKAAIISFGERMPVEAMQRASRARGERRSLHCDRLLAAGSAGRVAAACRAARRRAARHHKSRRDAAGSERRTWSSGRSIGSVFVALYPQLVN